MNRKQEQIIESLKRDILLHDGLGERFVEGYEYKKFEIEETNYNTVILFTIVGSKADEGTLAEILCRTRRHIFIAKRGGIKIANVKSKKNGHTLKNWPRGYWNAVHSVTG